MIEFPCCLVRSLLQTAQQNFRRLLFFAQEAGGGEQTSVNNDGEDFKQQVGLRISILMIEWAVIITLRLTFPLFLLAVDRPVRYWLLISRDWCLSGCGMHR